MPPTDPQAISASEFRDVFGTIVHIPLPNGKAIKCRKPELWDQVFHELMPMPLFNRVMEIMRGAATDAQGKLDVTELVKRGSKETAEFIDRWVCLAAITPAVVMAQEAMGPTALWIQEVPMTVRSEIFDATFQMAASTGATGGRAAAETFRVGADGGATGPDGATVQQPTVELVRSDGSKARF